MMNFPFRKCELPPVSLVSARAAVTMSQPAANSQNVIPNETEVALLDCKEAFEGMSDEEKLYAHHLAQACFKGGLIVLFQVRFITQILTLSEPSSPFICSSKVNDFC